MRRVAFVLGALLALGVGAGLLASRRDASTGDADDRAAPGTEPPAATASTMLRPSEPAIDLVGGPTPRRDAAPDADAPEERAGPAPARRTTRILVTSERGGEVEGLEIRRVASPYGPASEARDASIRVDVRRVGADVEFLDDGPPLHLGLRAPGRATEVVVARSDRTTLVPLLASRVVEGVVLEEGSERPAPDVTLVPDPSFRGESWLLPASSGPDGRFRLDLPLRGVTRVIADPGAGAARFVDLPGPAAPTADLVIHVVRRVSLGGRVLVGGVPVAGAILRSLDPYGPLHETRTDASGAYLVPRLPEGFLSVEVDLGVERGGACGARWRFEATIAGTPRRSSRSKRRGRSRGGSRRGGAASRTPVSSARRTRRARSAAPPRPSRPPTGRSSCAGSSRRGPRSSSA